MAKNFRDEYEEDDRKDAGFAQLSRGTEDADDRASFAEPASEPTQGNDENPVQRASRRAAAPQESRNGHLAEQLADSRHFANLLQAANATLEQERDEANAARFEAHCRLVELSTRLERERDEALACKNAQIDESLKLAVRLVMRDTERLDWLGAHDATLLGAGPVGTIGVVWWPEETVQRVVGGATIREAIDAARSGSPHATQGGG